MIGVEVNQADEHTQIDEKIKRDGFECMLDSEFVANLRGNLLYALITSKIFIRKRTSFRHWIGHDCLFYFEKLTFIDVS